MTLFRAVILSISLSFCEQPVSPLEITFVTFLLCFLEIPIISAVVYLKQQYYFKQCASNCELTYRNRGFPIHVISIHDTCSP